MIRTRSLAIATFAFGLGIGGATIATAACTPDATPSPSTTVAPAPAGLYDPNVDIKRPVSEDDPSWDCRTMGNQMCGTKIDPTPNNGKDDGIWYTVTFDDAGKPNGVMIQNP